MIAISEKIIQRRKISIKHFSRKTDVKNFNDELENFVRKFLVVKLVLKN